MADLSGTYNEDITKVIVEVVVSDLSRLGKLTVLQSFVDVPGGNAELVNACSYTAAIMNAKGCHRGSSGGPFMCVAAGFR